MNLSDAPRTLYTGARIGEVYPVTSRAQEIPQVDPQLSNHGELLDVHTTFNKGGGQGGNLPHRNERLDVHMDLKDLPEHLQPLMEWVAEDLTICEREELAAAIYDYRDVFSSGPTDIEQTDLVTHSIDTGENRPICLSPRYFLIKKQDVEQAEVQKMLDRAMPEQLGQPSCFGH